MENRVITNNHWRQFRYRNEVPESVLASEFEHLDEEEGFDGFFEYRGTWYHLSDFMFLKDNRKWRGYCSQTAWSAVVIRVSQDAETYQVGLAVS